jgi:hypothetical protein
LLVDFISVGVLDFSNCSRALIDEHDLSFYVTELSFEAGDDFCSNPVKGLHMRQVHAAD